MLLYYSGGNTTLVDREYVVVTTMNKDGFEKYGQRMVDSFIEYWPDHVSLIVYTEGFTLEDYYQEWPQNVYQRDLHECCPELVEFKERHKHRPDQQNPKELAHGAIRFAHKSFAVIHACMNTYGCIIWLDADTVTHSPVSEGFLDDLLPSPCYTSYLGRKNNYTECGFVMYDTNSVWNEQFMMMWRSLYITDELFNLPQWHDCMAYDAVRTHLEEQGMWSHNITPEGKNYDHVFINSPLGTVMDHLKGPRKDTGKSSLSDLYGNRIMSDEWSYFKGD